MKTHLKVGARPSRLSIIQANTIKRLIPHIAFEILPIATDGDHDKNTPLSGAEGKDFFTRQIEEALIKGEIDLAVHSAKDLEDKMPDELIIAAITSSINPHESLASRSGRRLNDLPSGSVIGTSSVARQREVLKLRPDLMVKNIRGTIEERLAQLDAGSYDAIIVAYAALIRLGLRERATEIFPADIFKPHPLQGRLAIQIRRDRKDLVNIFRSLNAE